MSSDPQEQMRQAARDVGQELQRVIDQCAKLARQAGEDLSRLVGDPRVTMRRRTPADATPAELIREIGRLRDEGLISEEEFEAKKADLLSRV
ncbi:MAG TPA: SHOCT domain-containing protein [Miltoncostaeaceae bacterium]|nr:SHOCT domain-containing protein [Miltoncostaeaceae bacterium]